MIATVTDLIAPHVLNHRHRVGDVGEESVEIMRLNVERIFAEHSTFEQEHIALSCGVDFYLVAENEIQTLSNNLREQMFRVGIDSMTALQQAQLTTGM